MRRISTARRWLTAAALILLPSALLAEENRLALIISNSQYAESPLVKPINDANEGQRSCRG